MNNHCISKRTVLICVDGDVYGRRICKQDGNTITLSIFPRNNINSYAREGEEDPLHQNCVYLLVNNEEKIVYAGKSSGFKDYREKNHKNDKDYWDEVYIFTSHEMVCDSAVIEVLECYLINELRHNSTWTVKNIIDAQLKIRDQWLEDVCYSYLESIKVLMNLMGCNALLSEESEITRKLKPAEKRSKEKDMKINTDKNPVYYYDDMLFSSAKDLILEVITGFARTHTHSEVENASMQFNQKLSIKKEMIATEQDIKKHLLKEYHLLELEGYKLYINKKGSGLNDKLCKALTVFGVQVAYVNSNLLDWPKGPYTYTANNCNLIISYNGPGEWVVKKGSVGRDENNKNIELHEDCIATSLKNAISQYAHDTNNIDKVSYGDMDCASLKKNLQKTLGKHIIQENFPISIS